MLPHTLLVPTVRSTAQSPFPRPRSPRLKPTPTKLIRARSGSASLPQSEPSSFVPNSFTEESFGLPLNLVPDHESFQLEGYQMYAVEKWIVDRKPIVVLSVYTGDLSHKISVTAFKPAPYLSPDDAKAEWERAIHHLRADGARPKETPYGTLMATSLAHFRSDYTIVHIPNGNFLSVRDQLYTNINLLRTGCSGRSALTLEEPSDATKDRFISTYHLPDTTDIASMPSLTSTDSLPLPSDPTPSASPSSKHRHKPSIARSSDIESPSLDNSRPGSLSKAAAGLGLGLPATLNSNTPGVISKYLGKTRDRTIFNATVLELVKIIQAALSIFGFYGSVTSGNIVLDGLLCDSTIDGLHKWLTEIADPLFGLEPMERIADPSLVSALLSTVLSVRNRLSSIGYGHIVPKDPFLHPQFFSLALAAHIQATATMPGPSLSLVGNHVIPHQHVVMPAPALVPAPFSLPYSPSPHISPANSSAPPHLAAILTRELLAVLISSHDGKTSKLGEGRKVRKAIREKIDDLIQTSGVASGVGSSVAENDDDLRSYAPSAPSSSFGLGGGAAGVNVIEEEAGAPTSGPILGGIGSLASGLGLGSNYGGSIATMNEIVIDLAAFVKVVVKDGINLRPVRGIAKGKGKVRDIKDSVDGFAIGSAYGKDKDKDLQFVTGVGGTIRALWTGKVWSIIKQREWELVHEKELTTNTDRKPVGDKDRRRDRRTLGIGSDGDMDGDVERLRQEKFDGRSTEEESDPLAGAGGFWGERVQRRLAWTGLTRLDGHKTGRKKIGMSLDLSGPPTARGPGFSKLGEIPATPVVIPPQTFTPGESIYPRYPRDNEDDDTLSSGQVSPIADRPGLLLIPPSRHQADRSAGNSPSTAIGHYIDLSRQDFVFDPKKTWNYGFASSPRLSARPDPHAIRRGLKPGKESADEFDMFGSESRGDSGMSGSESRRAEEPFQFPGYAGGSKSLFIVPKRRRSFHDLESHRSTFRLQPDQMRIDVELCGQVLTMMRRDEHLRDVATAVEVIANSLSDINTLLRDNHDKHSNYLNDLNPHSTVIMDINSELTNANRTSQATHTLRYEAEQFRMNDLWQAVSPPWHKVLDLRDKVFGTGGRRLAPGTHGADGRFNRLQWALDGQPRLVDKLGRTKREAEEEDRLFSAGASVSGINSVRRVSLRLEDDEGGSFPVEGPKEADSGAVKSKREVGQTEAVQQGLLSAANGGEKEDDEDEDEVVEHSGMKPMWLLRMFTKWGTGWGQGHGPNSTTPVTGGGETDLSRNPLTIKAKGSNCDENTNARKQSLLP